MVFVIHEKMKKIFKFYKEINPFTTNFQLFRLHYKLQNNSNSYLITLNYLFSVHKILF